MALAWRSAYIDHQSETLADQLPKIPKIPAHKITKVLVISHVLVILAFHTLLIRLQPVNATNLQPQATIRH